VTAALAFDLGAGSGRAIIGRLENGRLTIKEIHRFANDPVQVGDRLHWDILRLFHEIKQGLLKAKQEGLRVGTGDVGGQKEASEIVNGTIESVEAESGALSGAIGGVKAESGTLSGAIESIGIDSWAVDFGLIGENGELLGNPYHYRDGQTAGMMERVFERIPKEELFARTGLQFLPFNTIYQLFALQEAGSPILKSAKSLLLIPDLLRYFLSGEMHSEFTNATTTQLYHASDRGWDDSLIERLGLPRGLFVNAVDPGTQVGTIRPSLCEELGIAPIPIIAVAEHDTGSAVAAVPAEEESFAYLSCGTWSLMGTEVKQPVMSEQALAWNFTNEGGVGGTYRLLKNIMGLWLLQECKRAWEKEGAEASYEELLAAAERSEPFRSFIDPDDLQFLAPAHMPRQIRQYCQDTNQPEPETIGSIVRCVMESLALKYRLILERTEELAGYRYGGLHMVGGGINNDLLCQYTANALSRPVWAGPTEASAIGNLIVQFMALGQIPELSEARRVVRNSFPLRTYEPAMQAAWEAAYDRFQQVLSAGETV